MITKQCRVCGKQSFQTSEQYPWVCPGDSNLSHDTCERDKAKLINKIEIGTKMIVNGII